MTNDQAKTAAPPLFDANLFDVTGPIRINFSRSSIIGRPQLSYQDAEFDLNFQGEDLDILTTPNGDQVTVTVQTVPDDVTRRITLLVPVVRLVAGEQAQFETVLIETIDHSFAFVPTPGPGGVLQSYRVHQVLATAQHVDF